MLNYTQKVNTTLPDGYYILKLDRGNYSLRNGKTGNTVDVGRLKEILELV